MRTHLATARTSVVRASEVAIATGHLPWGSCSPGAKSRSGKDAGSFRSQRLRARLRTPPERALQPLGGRETRGRGPKSTLDLRLPVAGVAAEHPGRRELPELVPNHLLADEDGHVPATVVDRDRVPDHLGEDRRCPRPGADHLLAARIVHPADAAHQPLLDERPFLGTPTQNPLLRAK